MKGVIDWINHKENVKIAPEDVWHFDDRADNVAPFQHTRMNARQISCDSPDHNGIIGYCGAKKSEIVAEKGVKFCPRKHNLW